MPIGTEGIVPTLPMTVANGNGTDQSGMMNGSNSWVWILLLIVLLGGGNGGLFGNRDNAARTVADTINNDFLYTQQKVDGLRDTVISQSGQIQQSMNTGFDSITLGISNLGHQVTSELCGVNRNIDQTRFENAQNTCVITNAISAANQAVLSYLTGQEIANWRDRAQAAELRENNANQTAAIINSLRPYPTPSYAVVPPPVTFGYGPVYDR